ncbi:hypothetical protein BDR26DRAFT_890798 [Obelidium mucronatum]|nr:hypothetical protein BDR26DRAFT_890798 [Obelidium mucronatum]
MRGRRVDLQMREAIIARLEDGRSVSDVADWFGVHARTIRRIRKTYLNYGLYFNPSLSRSGRPMALGGKDLAVLQTLRREQPDLYFDELAIELSNRLHRPVTIRHVQSAFRLLRITRKKLSIKFKQRCEEDFDAFRWRMYMELDPAYTWWLDEMRVDDKNFRRTHGYGHTSERVQAEQTGLRGESVTVLAAMSLNGVECEYCVDGSSNTEIFMDFLQNELVNYKSLLGNACSFLTSFRKWLGVLGW